MKSSNGYRWDPRCWLLFIVKMVALI
jgi:hypothetical protein